MADYAIKKELLSSRERSTLDRFNAELSASGLSFKRMLTRDEMRSIGQIIVDLKSRTADEDNHVSFALGDWLIQADEWFGTDAGIRMALLTKPTQFSSCFVSYSHKDEEFAKRLWSRLTAASIEVFYAPEDVKGGEKLHEQIDHAIQTHDRLLIVLSENSLQSEWVMTEIRKARKVEIKEKRRKLFPIRLVSMERLQEWECFDSDTGKDLAVEVREYFIPDFSDWTDPEAFQASFGRLLDDLRAAEKKSTLVLDGFSYRITLDGGEKEAKRFLPHLMRLAGADEGSYELQGEKAVVKVRAASRVPPSVFGHFAETFGFRILDVNEIPVVRIGDGDGSKTG